MTMSLKQMVTNDGMISQSWIWKYKEGSDCDLIWHVVFVWIDCNHEHHDLFLYVTILFWELEFDSVKQ